MSEDIIGADECYKYIFKKLNARFHRRLGYDCERIDFINIELIPPDRAHKFMDIGYVVDGKEKYNIEFQSTAVYDPKMEDMYKYRIYSQADDYSPFKTCVFATYPPTQGIENRDFDGDVDFHPDFFYTKNLKASETLNVVRNKNERISLRPDRLSKESNAKIYKKGRKKGDGKYVKPKSRRLRAGTKRHRI